MKKSNSFTLRLVYTAMFSALICVLTAFAHIPMGNGYIHVGDSMIYLCSMVLPFPYGIIAGALGGGLSDLISGYAIYVIPTAIVKSLNALVFYLIAHKSATVFCFKSVLATVISGIVTIIAYYAVAVYLYGGWVAQAPVILENLIQAVGSGAVFLCLAKLFDGARLKQKLRI